MTDPTERIRREMVEELNSLLMDRDTLARKFGLVWNTDELLRDFEVQSFLAPFVLVTRKSDGVEGTLMFQHNPRFYFSFTPNEEE